MANNVTRLQWGIVVIGVILGASSYLMPSYQEMVSLTAVIVLLNILLILNLLIEAVSTKIIGKLLLTICCFICFHLEAITSAVSEPSFANNLRTNTFSFSQYSLQVVRQTYVYISLFQFMLFVGYSINLKMKTILSFARSRVDSRPSVLWSLRYVVTALSFIVPVMQFGFSLDSMISGMTFFYEGTRLDVKEPGILNNLTYAGAAATGLVLLDVVLFSKNKRTRYISIGWATIAILPLLLSGVRHLFVYSFFSVIVSYLRLNKGLSLKRVLRWGGLALLLGLVVQVQVVMRTRGWGNVENLEASSFAVTRVSGQFEALMMSVQLVPTEHDYFYEVIETVFITYWIPRSLWPDKPLSETWKYFNDTIIEGSIGTWTPSVIGQFYMSWGILGVLYIGLCLGLLTSMLDKVIVSIDIENQRAMANLIGNFYAFIALSFRLYEPYYFAFVVFAGVLMIMLTRRSDEMVNRVFSEANSGFAIQPRRIGN